VSYFTHLECSVPCGGDKYDPRVEQHLCPKCAMPLLARYDLDAARGWKKESLADREPTMWRYRELMPLFDGEQPITLGEGWTPLLHAKRLGSELGLPRLFVKDESLNPTNSFKARGQSAAITRAQGLGVTTVSVPSAGNAGNAMAAYAARAGLRAEVFLPSDVKTPFARECVLYGANVTLVDGLITDAARLAAERGGPLGWYDVSTLKEPYRIEGKKTMGIEIAEQLEWRLPTHIVYPTGGGTGLIGMWKVFAEMLDGGWLPANVALPRMISAQAAGCAPIVRAFESGATSAIPWEDPQTHASGLRVPGPLGDRLILRAIRQSNGFAAAVSEDVIAQETLRLSRETGVDAAPEGGCALGVLEKLVRAGAVARDAEVVLFNTGSGASYRF
jgi:threonine synthase